MTVKESKTYMDQQYINLFYGNEDKSEETGLVSFISANDAAAFLEKVASNIRKHGNSKVYRGSPESIFNGTEHDTDFFEEKK